MGMSRRSSKNEAGMEKIVKKQIKKIILKALFLSAFSLFSIGLHAGAGDALLLKICNEYILEGSDENKTRLLKTIKAATNDKDKLDAKDSGGKAALYLAAENGKKEIVSKLLEARACVDLKNNEGDTPLCAAAINGHREIVEVLLGKDANPNFKGNDGKIPLHYAALFGHTGVVRLLTDARTNPSSVSKKDYEGKTPLHHAMRNRHTSVVKLLLDKDADLNVDNKSNYTLFHYAAYFGRTDIVTLLLNRGADPNIANKNGDTPLRLAEKRGVERKFLDTIKAFNKHNKDAVKAKGADLINVVDKADKKPFDTAVKTDEIKELLQEKKLVTPTKQLPAVPTVTPPKEKPDKPKEKKDEKLAKKKPDKFAPLKFLKEHKGKIVLGAGALAGAAAIGGLVYWIYHLLKRRKKVAALVKQLRAYHQTESPEEYNRLKNQILRGVDPAIKKQVEQRLPQVEPLEAGMVPQKA
jgi:ankyrin repeat protein